MAPSTKKTDKIEVRLPSELKSAFQRHCEATGLTASEALRAFVEGQTTHKSFEPLPSGHNTFSMSEGAHSGWFSPSVYLNAARKASTKVIGGLTLFVGCMFLALFIAIATLKPLWSDHVGLFRMADGTLSAGIVADTRGSQDLLGLWSMPIAMGIAALLFTVLAPHLRRSAGRLQVFLGRYNH